MNIKEIRGAVARGWCTPENSAKIMDTDLAEAISQEIFALLLAHMVPETRLSTRGKVILHKNEDEQTDPGT